MTERFGTWQLETVIAVGGLGEVWRARRDGEVAALKRLHTHLIRNDDVRALFALEQRLTSELPHHANVVHAIEAGAIHGRPYIALALAPGEDLRRLLAPPPRGGPGDPAAASPPRVVLSRARVRAIVIAACDAAAHLHDHGYVHGDINPGNLVIDERSESGGRGTTGSAGGEGALPLSIDERSESGARATTGSAGGEGALPLSIDDNDRVTLIDLGIARPIGGAGAVRGTHAYMAPEQVRGEPWTPATDVFALGVVLWELVSGARLFHRGPPWLSQAAVIEATVPALDDPALDAIAQAALAKDRAQRIPSAGELADRLRAL